MSATKPEKPSSDDAREGTDFIREKIRADLAAGRYEGVITRFPPEPNGYPHIGHAKAICVNYGIAEDFDGRYHLRFDDTNPETESPEYVEAIQRDIRWLGFDWGEHLYFASDYFERMVELAEQLVRDGKAYVDSQSAEEIRENRGTITEPGTPSPYRERSVEENLDLLRRMRDGEFDDGAHVLRAKIDMAAKNMLMRDPLLLRIRKAHHYRKGDGWCLYPMYDYAHCLEDAFENITHSLCSLEFENNRELYDWVLDACGFEHPRPEQTEFARLNLGYTVMSKRKLLKLVEEGYVAGWDDPRMPTLSGLRRRGVPPEAIRDFCDRVGITRNYNVIDVALLEHSTREALNFEAPRRMAVIDPLSVVVENWDDGEIDRLEADAWPRDVPKEGTREVPFSRRLFIERDDFREDPPAGYFRLAPGREVRLRYAYLFTCREVVKDDDGEIVEIRGTVDRESRGGNAPDGRKVKGTIHWVSAEEGVASTFRVYDRLFSAERPGLDENGEEVDFREHLNPESLVVHEGFVEPSLAEAEPGARFQFERLGYFTADSEDSKPGAPVWNRTVTLRDTWAKVEQQGDTDAARRAAEKAAARAAHKEAQRKAAEEATEEALDPATQAIADSYVERGVQPQDARLFALDADLRAFFDAALAAHDEVKSVARWTTTELLGRLDDERSLADLPFDGAALGRLAALVDGGTINNTAGKKVLDTMVEEGGDPAEIVEARGLRQIDDRGALEPVIDQVLAENAAQVEEYRAGKVALLGFFVGQAMRASGGKADPQLVRELLGEKLAG